MSGPKVVRIVTREEVQALCLERIAVFDHVATELERFARRNNVWTSDLEEAVATKRRALQDLFDRHRWANVQKRATMEAEFLLRETERLKAHLVAEAEVARTERRRLADAARSIANALESAGHDVSAELRDVASRALAAGDAELAGMKSVLNAALLELVPAAPSVGVSAAQKDLAARLGGGEQALTYADWLVANAPQRESDTRLDRLLAELDALEDRDAANRFVERAVTIAGETSPNRRALLTDSLILDLTAQLRVVRRRESLFAAMREARDRHQRLCPQSDSLMRELDQAIASSDVTVGEHLIEEARKREDGEIRRAAAFARRRAVLKGLAALGYEVRENMASAWAQDGRLVVRKAGSTDYGVELGATPDADRMQVRVVGAAQPLEPRTSQRDFDAEATWCNDFARLTRTLEEAGSEFNLEHAVPVGAQPVKTVPMPDVTHDQRSHRRPRERAQ
jgi:hypothetical protein